jgi:hypothetical protein
MQRKMINLMLALTLLAVILAGCNDPTPSPTTQTATAQPTEESVAATTEVPNPASCVTELAAPSDPDTLASIPTWTDALVFEDPRGDFVLDHPLFEENFDAFGVYDQAEIPHALDITAVTVGPEGEYYFFDITTARAETSEGESLPELLRSGRRTARIGIFVDIDHNGASDYLLTTTDEEGTGVVLPPTLDEPIAELELNVGDSSITMLVPRSILGDRFDWMAFTGYSPIEGAYFSTPLEFVFFVPAVDVYYPQDLPGMVGFSTSYSGTGRVCQVTGTAYNAASIRCPPQGNPTLTPVPGTSYQGVLMYQVQCDGRGYAFWCINQSFFGKEVLNGSHLGWVAKCPFTCGLNDEGRWDTDSDGLVDQIFHTVTDVDCLYDTSGDGIPDKLVDVNGDGTKDYTHHDGDNDGYLDVMEHRYLYATNELTSCNKERTYKYGAPATAGGPPILKLGSVENERCKAPQQPYTLPSQVPGAIPPTPTPSP